MNPPAVGAWSHDVRGMHDDVRSYYINFGFLDTSTPEAFYRRVVRPSLIAPDPSAAAAAAAAAAGTGAGGGSTAIAAEKTSSNNRHAGSVAYDHEPDTACVVAFG